MSLARFAFAPRFPVNTFWREVDELFQTATPNALTPSADVLETDKTVQIHLDMPGVAPEAIDVKLEGNQLTITAERQGDKVAEAKGWIRRERSHGTFRRTFTLTDSLDGTQPEATYRHGVLVVTVPKREAAQPRSLKVKVEA